MLTIHGRTRQQFNKGLADWKFISRVKDNVNIPVIANGDITCFNSAKKCLFDSKADGIMIGRAAYGRPWILRKFSKFLDEGVRETDPDLLEQKNVLINIEFFFEFENKKLFIHFPSSFTLKVIFEKPRPRI